VIVSSRHLNRRRAAEAGRLARLERTCNRSAGAVHAEARHRQRGKEEQEVCPLEEVVLGGEPCRSFHTAKTVQVSPHEQWGESVRELEGSSAGHLRRRGGCRRTCMMQTAATSPEMVWTCGMAEPTMNASDQ
jgi:hypothetical protein